MGKFGDDPIAEALYNVTLDGFQDDQCGNSTDGPGWYALLLDMRDALRDQGVEEFEDEHYILEEDTYGFVVYYSFATADEAREAFDLLREELGDWA